MKLRIGLFLLISSVMANLYLLANSRFKDQGQPQAQAGFPVSIDRKIFYPGWLVYQEKEADWDGYLLFSQGRGVAMIDEKGESVHQWKTENLVSRVQLLKTGNLIYSSLEGHSTLQMIGPDGQVKWVYPSDQEIKIDRIFDAPDEKNLFVLRHPDPKRNCTEVLHVNPESKENIWSYNQTKSVFKETDCRIYFIEYSPSAYGFKDPLLLLASAEKAILLDVEKKKPVWSHQVQGRILFVKMDRDKKGVLLLHTNENAGVMRLTRFSLVDQKSETVIENLASAVRGSVFEELGPYKYLFSDANLRITEVKKDFSDSGTSPWYFQMYSPHHNFRLYGFQYVKELPKNLAGN